MAPTSEFFSLGKFHFISFVIFTPLFFCSPFQELIISQILDLLSWSSDLIFFFFLGCAMRHV